MVAACVLVPAQLDMAHPTPQWYQLGNPKQQQRVAAGYGGPREPVQAESDGIVD